MVEEFHGNGLSGSDFKGKLLYGWNTINTNIWLPSMIELVGYDPDKYYEPRGCYASAMQELNISTSYYVDRKGGNQFAYFKQYNASGGGTRIWLACNRQQSWLRSTDLDNTTDAWRTTSAQNLNAPSATASLAVHPAVDRSRDACFSTRA